jgi:hypothetical protein
MDGWPVSGRGHGNGPIRREVAGPLASLASTDDVEHARGLLAMHQPRAVVRRVCGACGDQWPCVDTLYAWAVTGTLPEGGLPGPSAA